MPRGATGIGVCCVSLPGAVLFACTQNKVRSPLAAALLRLRHGRALRLGHGVRITDDLDIEQSGTAQRVVLGPLAEWVRDRRIALEICPTSNVHTNAFDRFGSTITEHPFDLLYQLGFAVTVNTDNRLMSGTSLSREIANLAEVFGYDLNDVLQWQLSAADAAFLPSEDRDELADFLVAAYTR